MANWLTGELVGEGKKIGANDAVYHRFPPPAWGTQELLSGSWPVIEVSDSPNGSQNSSMIWPYLIWTGLLLNIDSFLRLGSVPRDSVGGNRYHRLCRPDCLSGSLSYSLPVPCLLPPVPNFLHACIL